MKNLDLLLALCLSLCTSLVATADHPTSVRVALYPYEPFVAVDEQGQFHGLAADLITLLNSHQQELHFTSYPISPKRRFDAFEQHEFDIILFENPQWGWQNIEHQISEPFFYDRDVYVALQGEDRDESYFNDISRLKILAISGFHYGFAEFNADEQYLEQNFDIVFSWSYMKNLEMLCDRQGDVTIISWAYLRDFIQKHPDKAADFLISQRSDNQFKHQAIIHPRSPADSGKLNRIFSELKTNGHLAELFQRYNALDCDDLNSVMHDKQIQALCL